jgi:hypothetical protein
VRKARNKLSECSEQQGARAPQLTFKEMSCGDPGEARHLPLKMSFPFKVETFMEEEERDQEWGFRSPFPRAGRVVCRCPDDRQPDVPQSRFEHLYFRVHWRDASVRHHASNRLDHLFKLLGRQSVPLEYFACDRLNSLHELERRGELDNQEDRQHDVYDNQ